MAHCGRLELVGVQQLLDALEDGEHRAEGEQHDRHDEGPEVALAAVAERVDRGRLLLGPVAAEQQQELVAGVGQRVHALGQHRRRPGEDEADELGDGDAEVGQQGGEDGSSCSLRSTWRGFSRVGPTGVGRVESVVRPSRRPATTRPMASEAVAAGDGALTHVDDAGAARRSVAGEGEVVEQGAVRCARPGPAPRCRPARGPRG